ncbi:MAG TPA: DoxX family protein [Anaeromyxobacteraceae bacterium]|nr:DoxX family protein [Anaeromyxobacteraceae bacterium]
MEGKLQAWWPAPLRIVIGISFVVAGAPKLTSAGHAGFAAMLGQIGIALPSLMAWLVALLELFGGIALLVGLFTAEATVLLGVEMLVAMFKVHLAHGFSVIQITGTSPDGSPVFGLPGAQLNLLFLAALLALFIGGAGPLALEERLFKPESRLRPPWLRHHEAHA